MKRQSFESIVDPDGFVPARLTLARERRGLTKEQLAQLCGVSRRSVTDWEAGAVVAPPVALLSAALGFPIRFFLLDESDALDKTLVSFRALSSVSARRVRMVLAQASIAAHFWDWFDARYELPLAIAERKRLDELIEQSVDASPGTMAGAVRRAWGLGTGPIGDVLAALEARGFRVLALSPEVREVDAFSFWRDGRPYIFLNVEKSSERLRFDLAHELGHLLMHAGIKANSSRGLEDQANEFAAELLMPAGPITRQVRGRVGMNHVLELRTQWRVSAMAMLRRLHQLTLVSDWNYRSWVIDLSQQGYRSFEPGGLPRETSQLLRGILDYARSDGYGIPAICQEIGITKEDFSEYILGLAMVSVSDATRISSVG